jgi:uncharacterized OB-fold protein
VTDPDPALESPVPVPDAVSAGFWEAAAEGVLAIARCQTCRSWDHPPQERCRFCAGEMSFEAVSGRGEIFSFIVNRRQFVPGHPPPRVIALVELEEQAGLRLTGLVDADPGEVAIGRPVRAEMAPIGASGWAGPLFRLV